LVLVVLALLLSIASGALSAPESPDSVQVLSNDIRELRVQARYGEAAEAARELLALRRADPEAKPFEIVEAEQVLRTLEHAAGLSEAERVLLARADSLTHVCEELWLARRFSEGSAASKRQLEIRRGVLGDQDPDVAESLAWVGTFLDAEQRYAEAEPFFRNALEQSRAIYGEEHPNVAIGMRNLAVLFQSRGDLDDAELLLRQSLALNRELWGDEHPYVISGLKDLAALLWERGEYADAEELLREKLALCRDLYGEEHAQTTRGLNDLGTLLRERGNYVGAVALLRQALATYRRIYGDEHPQVAVILNNLAAVLRDQGNHADAEPLLRETLEMRKKLFGAEHTSVSTGLNNLASLLRDQGRYAEAEPLYREALAMSRSLLGEEHPSVAHIMSNLGLVLQDQGDYEAAEPLLSEALAMRRKLLGEEHPHVALSLSNLASLSQVKGDDETAERLFREALELRRRLLGEQHPHVCKGLHQLGRFFLSRGDPASAEPVLAEAAALYDAARLRAGPGLERTTFLDSPYSHLAAARLALGREDEAWPAMEKALARSLADLLLAAERRELDALEIQRQDSLARQLGDLEREMSAYRNASGSDTGNAAWEQAEREARSRLLEAEAQWSSFQLEMAVRYPVSEGTAFSLERVRSALRLDAALIGWLDVSVRRGEFESWGYVIRKTGAVEWARLSGSRPGSDDDPYERARFLRRALADPVSSEAGVGLDLHKFWRKRVRPLRAALDGAEKLIVIPSGAMLGVPLEALVDDEGVVLGERYAVSYVPSATVYTWLTEKAEQERGTETGAFLMVGDPPFTEAHLATADQVDEKAVRVASRSNDPWPEMAVLRGALVGQSGVLRTLPRLPGAREEIRTVASIAPEATLLLGSNASEQALVRLADGDSLRGFSVLHMATHALVDHEHPERSALILSQVDLPDPLDAALSGDRIYDGLLTAKEIVSEWHLEADLVTLSACETGLGRRVRGEGYVGFANAFLQAGARSLLVSLWRVEDHATSLLMQRFYENYTGSYDGDRPGYPAGSMPKTVALQEAKRWLREYTDKRGSKPFRHPYYWSAFILIGETD
jgi:CHAT domain-containing protein/tetratricopeptide (TPR) repeat protein